MYFVLAQIVFCLFGSKVCILGKKKRKPASNSLTQFYATVIILFCCYATEN